MKADIKSAVEEYQCSGCVCGSDTGCYEGQEGSLSCGKHVAGTNIFPHVGRIFLGLPNGFNRFGSSDNLKMHVFQSLSDGWGYDLFNIPVWKHLNSNGHTIVRGMSPRINDPWIHIFLGNYIGEIDCLEVTDSDIEGMD